MKPSLDRTLKTVWLAIGVLVLGTLAVSLVVLAAGSLRIRGATAAAERVAAEGLPAGEAARPVRLSLPQPVAGTETRIAFVEPADASTAPRIEPGRRHGVLNVVFLDPDGSARLLLDRPALIREVRFPPTGGAGAAPPSWISYEIVLEGPEERGPSRLYLSEPDGRNLRPVVAPPLRHLAHQPFGPGRLLVYAHDPVAPPRQRAYLYDVAAETLTPLASLDSAAAEAARILGRQR